MERDPSSKVTGILSTDTGIETPQPANGRLWRTIPEFAPLQHPTVLLNKGKSSTNSSCCPVID